MGSGGPPALYGRCPPSGPCGARDLYAEVPEEGEVHRREPVPPAQVRRFNSVYCFRGPTRVLTAEPRDDGSGIDGRLLLEVLEAAHEAAGVTGSVEAMDFSSNGEPTLHPGFPELVDAARSFLGDRGVDAGLGGLGGWAGTPRLTRTRRA